MDFEINASIEMNTHHRYHLTLMKQQPGLTIHTLYLIVHLGINKKLKMYERASIYYTELTRLLHYTVDLLYSIHTHTHTHTHTEEKT